MFVRPVFDQKSYLFTFSERCFNCLTETQLDALIKLVVLSFRRLQGLTGQPRHSKMIAFRSPTFVIRHFLEVRQAWQLAVAVK